jgi:excisionase family DNA binding protein
MIAQTEHHTRPILVTLRRAAELLGVSTRTVQNLIAAKELPSRKIGRRRLIPYSALQALARRDAHTGRERGAA